MTEYTHSGTTGDLPPGDAASGSTDQDHRGTTGVAAAEARGVATTAVEETKSVAGTAADEAKAVVQDATGQARYLADEARSRLRAELDDQSNRLAGTLGDVGRQLRSMSANADDPDSAVTRFAGQAADSVERFASRLEDGGVDRALDDVKRFARNQPTVFLLGALGAGFVVGRLLKAADLGQVMQGRDGDGNGQSDGRRGLSASGTAPASWPSPERVDEYAELATATPTAPAYTGTEGYTESGTGSGTQYPAGGGTEFPEYPSPTGSSPDEAARPEWER
jgi:hypothetical protein